MVQVRSDRRYRFDVEPEMVWDALGRVDEYRRWWPWLRRFEAQGLVPGDRWICVVSPPLPYELEFVVRLLEVEQPLRVTAEVSGDILGPAVVEVSPVPGGSEVRLQSMLAPRRGPLRVVAGIAPWLADFGHNWVLDTGLGEFRRHALWQGPQGTSS